MEIADAEIVERCVCSACEEYVCVDEGNTCAGCSRDCVIDAQQWKPEALRIYTHSLTGPERELAARLRGAIPPTDRPPSASMEFVSGAFARALRTVRRAGIRRYGAVAVDVGTALVVGGVALGGVAAVKHLRKRY